MTGISAVIMRSTVLIIFLTVTDFFHNLKENGQIDIGFRIFYRPQRDHPFYQIEGLQD